MSEKFKQLFETIDKSEDELWSVLGKCVNKTYKFINEEGITFEISVEYFRGFDQIGVVHIAEGESVVDEWDVEEFYEIIKNSTEI